MSYVTFLYIFPNHIHIIQFKMDVTTKQTSDKQTATTIRKRNSNNNNVTVVTSVENNLLDSYQHDYQQQPVSPASSSTSQTTGDTTFEPSIDMMVNDFDDEQTLTEEEALAELEAQDPADEISTLQKESEIPLEELLAHYRQHVEQDYQQRRQKRKKSAKKNRSKKQSKRNSSHLVATTETGNILPITTIDEVIVIEESDDEVEVFKTEQADTDNGEDCLVSSDTQSNYHRVCEDEDADDEGAADDEGTADLCEEDEIEGDTMFSGRTIDFSKRSHLLELYPEKFSRIPHKLGDGFSEDDDDDDDEDDDDDSDYAKRTIMVGSTYQATIPVGLSKYGDVLPYENEDKLIWEPSQVSEQEVEEYLMRVKEIKSSSSTITTQDEDIPSSSASVTSESDQGLGSSLVKDDEQALHLLVQCGYNFKEALRRNRLNAVPLTGSMSLWSEEECRNFEDGIQKFGKDFRKIRQNQVRTRSIRELVQFYYLWKKTDRRDQDFIDSDTVDHMDQYLDFDERDTVSNGGTKHVSSSLSSDNLGLNSVFTTKKLGAATSSAIKNFSILNDEKHLVTCSSTSKKSSGSKKSSNNGQTASSNDVPVYRRRNSLLTTNKPHHLDNNSMFITKCSAETSSQVTGKIWRNNPSTASAAITSTTGYRFITNK